MTLIIVVILTFVMKARALVDNVVVLRKNHYAKLVTNAKMESA